MASKHGIKSQAKIVEVVMVISGCCVSLQTIYNADSPDRTNTSSHPFLNQIDTFGLSAKSPLSKTENTQLSEQTQII